MMHACAFAALLLQERMFEKDWVRACAKEKFSSFMARENKGNKANKPDKLAMQVGGWIWSQACRRQEAAVRRPQGCCTSLLNAW